ncbi:unnamed protein product [Durusdinium trenchii]|uniref:Uncharacterized protein n=1 Tax=Durusdinium trenchii TaxID=1381693 RepID=A0ABP0N2N4_9DINO
MDFVTLLSAPASHEHPDAVEASALVFIAEVEVFNPNLFTSEASEGHLELICRGMAGPVGEGAFQAVTLEPHVTKIVTANLSVKLREDFLTLMQAEIAASRFSLSFSLLAASTLRIFSLQLQYQMACELDVALSALMMSETRSGAVTGKNCWHQLSL